MKNKAWIRRIALLYLIALIFGFWGYMVGGYHFFPYALLHKHYIHLKDFLKGGEGQNKTLMQKLTTGIQEIENRFVFGGFVKHDKDFNDPGFLLISRYSKQHKQCIVELVRVNGFEVLHRWVPPIKDLLKLAGRPEDLEDLALAAREYRCQHPLLLKDGSIIVMDGEGPLARISKNNEVQWAIGMTFHHSIEMDPDGNIVTTIYEEGKLDEIHDQMKEETILVISPEGKILRRFDIVQDIIKQGYFSLMGGVNEIVSHELLHLNDIQPIIEDRGLVKRGDYALSFQRISAVAFYRPSENKILQLQQGPWLKQHDINALPDGLYSVFNNNAYALQNVGYFMAGDHSSISLWDPEKKTVEEPYETAFEKADIRTTTQGRARILSNGDAFVEETQWNRLLRISENSIRWEYVNADPEFPNISGALHWSRYYLPEEVNLDWLNK